MQMTHSEIEQQELIERYVRHDLPRDERVAFEEHFFACDECFARVQVMEKFVAGVQNAAATGLLADAGAVATRPQSLWSGWLNPALVAAAAAAVVLALGLAWFVFVRPPAMREQIAQQQQPPQQTPSMTNPTVTNPTVSQSAQQPQSNSGTGNAQQSGAERKSTPPVTSTTPGGDLARRTAPTPGESETSESAATRSTRQKPSRVSLSSAKRIYVEATGLNTLSGAVRELVAARLTANASFEVVGKEDADALLRLSVAAANRNAGTVQISAKLINAAGAVIWSTKGRLYLGSPQDSSQKLVNDLIHDAQTSRP
jgi:anti-sigma factor RsiW